MTYQKPENAYENAEEAIVAMKGELGFQDILEAAYGTAEHPKANQLFNLAWEYGHSQGFQAILDYYENLTDLLS